MVITDKGETKGKVTKDRSQDDGGYEFSGVAAAPPPTFFPSFPSR